MVNNRIGYILCETAPAVSEVEVLEKGSRVTAKGILQTGNQQNRNGRIYRTPDLAREISAPRQMELLAHKQMLGEAGHPMTTDLMRQQTIDPKCQCVRYLKFWMEGDNVMGIFKGTNNDLGDAFDKDLREGVLPAFSFRALGTIEESNKGAIVNNLKMITYDYVIYPSHPTAYTAGIVSESAADLIGSSIKKSNVAALLENTRGIDGSKSLVVSFTNDDVVKRMKELSAQREQGAIDYIKDQSKRYSLLKECFDITKAANVDLVDNGKIVITEAGIGTITMDVEDYISKEIMAYTKF